jgi:hypothetical protein
MIYNPAPYRYYYRSRHLAFAWCCEMNVQQSLHFQSTPGEIRQHG